MRRSTAPAIVSALAALVLYLPTLRSGFVWDDVSLIAENRYLADPAERWANLTGDFFRRSEDPDRIGHWRPVVTATLMADRALYGLEPGGFHLTNVLVHAATSALVAAVAIASGLGPLAAGFAGVLFAVHPAHVESVAWISGRTDLLCGLFVVAGLLADRSRSRARVALAAACTAGALLSKEIGIALPIAIAFRAWLLPRDDERLRPAARRSLVAVAPHAAVIAAYLVVRIGLLGIAPKAAAASEAGHSSLFWTWWSGFLEYVRLLTWPDLLTIAPRVPLASGPSDPRVLAGIALFAAIGAAAWRLRRRHPLPAFCLAWFLASFAPLTNFVITARAAADVPFPWAERFVYVPSIALVLAAACGFGEAARRSSEAGTIVRRSLFPALGIVLATGLAARSAVRAEEWRDERRLFASTVREAPAWSPGHASLGTALAAAGDRPGAEARYREAIALEPRNALARYNLGNLLRERGDLDEAIEQYRTAADLLPEDVRIVLNLGVALQGAGRHEEALAAFDRAAALDPARADAQINRGNMFRLLGSPEAAIEAYRAALRLDPASPAARLGLAGTFIESGRFPDAEPILRDLVRDAPDLAAAHLLAGVLYDAMGRTAEAERAYREVLRLDPGNEKVRRRLGPSRPSSP